MATATSRLTARGQISVPAEIRRKLGLDPGAVLEWHEVDGEVIVRRAGRYSSEEIHDVLFAGHSARRKAPVTTAEGIRQYVRRRHARR
jgi:AbrB family looped-hinge helix DNA binding protein